MKNKKEVKIKNTWQSRAKQPSLSEIYHPQHLTQNIQAKAARRNIDSTTNTHAKSTAKAENGD